MGAPSDWTLTITDATLSAGAGFVVAIAGSMMLMPGLGKTPQAQKLDVDERATSSGWITDEPARAAIRSRAIIARPVEYLIKQYPLETGALEIQYIEEFFGEFPRRKTAAEVMARLRGSRVAHPHGRSAAARRSRHARAGVLQGRARTARASNRAQAARSGGAAARLRRRSTAGKVLYSWIGATRRDWRGQGHFRALTEESEAWAVALGFQEVVVKTKNKFYDMRAVLTQLGFDVVKFERHAGGPASRRCI